jgi:peroxiredoxin
MKNRRCNVEFFAVLVLTMFFGGSALPCRAVTAETGDRAPLFVPETLAGEKFSLKEHLGRNVVLLDFWSVSCRNCISRIEVLNENHDLFQKRDFELIGIAGDPPADRMLSQVKNYAAKIHLQGILDPELELFERNGKIVMPIQSPEPEPLKRISDAVESLTTVRGDRP